MRKKEQRRHTQMDRLLIVPFTGGGGIFFLTLYHFCFPHEDARAHASLKCSHLFFVLPPLLHSRRFNVNHAVGLSDSRHREGEGFLTVDKEMPLPVYTALKYLFE